MINIIPHERVVQIQIVTTHQPKAIAMPTLACDDPHPMGFNVSQVQPTPNPNAAKFVLDRSVSPQPISFFTPAAAEGHPLAKKLFAIDGVTSLLLLGDFITVNKSPNAQWSQITKAVKQVLAAEE
jgi:hypothetical protein